LHRRRASRARSGSVGRLRRRPRRTWQQLGGFADDYFMYHEDVDLSLRLRLAGGRIGVIPDARVDHDYDFDKGPAKWRVLERNRWATLLRTYPAPLLALRCLRCSQPSWRWW